MCDKRSKEEQEALYAEYEMLEALGLLLRLPVPLGTTVYKVYADDCGNDPCSYSCNTCKYGIWKVEPVKFNSNHISEWNKTVFLSEELANKLKELNILKYNKSEEDEED